MVSINFRKNLLGPVISAVETHQKELEVAVKKDYVLLDGNFVVSSELGPFASFKIKVHIFPSFPWKQPQVFELGKRIPRTDDRHINTDGSCCLCVWSEWLAKQYKKSFDAFLEGPMRNYFYSQVYFEHNEKWPYGERSHGIEGILESCTEHLCLPKGSSLKVVEEYLRLFSCEKIKGHQICPCGNGKKIRDCSHRGELEKLKCKISPKIVKSYIGELAYVAELERKRVKELDQPPPTPYEMRQPKRVALPD